MSQMLNGYPSKVSYQRRSYSCLVDLAQNPGQLRMIRAAAGHPDVVQAVMSEEQAEAALANIRAANAGKVRTAGQPVSGAFTRGKIVRHKPTGKKVTIIRCAVGRKDGDTLHEVVDQSSGKRFMARQSNLRGLA